ncbi:MAG: hypothetical protein AAF899_12960 [Pseudomonadota bacterium]
MPRPPAPSPRRPDRPRGPIAGTLPDRPSPLVCAVEGGLWGFVAGFALALVLVGLGVLA